MKISELIEYLESIKKEHGDLELVIEAGDNYLLENTIECNTLTFVTKEKDKKGKEYIKLSIHGNEW